MFDPTAVDIVKDHRRYWKVDALPKRGRGVGHFDAAVAYLVFNDASFVLGQVAMVERNARIHDFGK